MDALSNGYFLQSQQIYPCFSPLKQNNRFVAYVVHHIWRVYEKTNRTVLCHVVRAFRSFRLRFSGSVDFLDDRFRFLRQL